MPRLRFSKMHGLGNDFVVLDSITQKVALSSTQIRQLANRHTGIGFDQLLLIEPPQTPTADFRYRIFNADGSEVEHCGNGARCFVNFVHKHQLSGKNPLVVETQRGIIRLEALANDAVRVNMGIPSFKPCDLPFDPTHTQIDTQHENQYALTINDSDVSFGVVSVGNPHAVIRVADVDTAAVHEIGAAIEAHPSFSNHVNVGFLQIVTPHQVRLRVFERGVGETQACGTGACAAVAYARQQAWVESAVDVALVGGHLQIEYHQLDADLYMTGPAAHVYNGSINIAYKDTRR